jgi:hypothetical protein
VLFVLTGASGSARRRCGVRSTSDLSLADTCTWVLDWIAAQQRSTPPLSGPWWD